MGEEGFNPFPPAPEPVSELGRYRVLSSTAGVRVSPLQLGAMSIDDAWNLFMGAMSKTDSFKLLDAYHELGGNFIDTANNYQNGQSEEWIGEWMKARSNRDLIVLATKYSFAAEAHKLGNGKTVTMTGNHKKSMHIALHQSLKSFRPTISICTMSIGGQEKYSTLEFQTPRLGSCRLQMSTLYHEGRWNVMARDFERDIIPMARHHGMALAPWDVIRGGKFQSQKQIAARKGEPLRAVGHTGQTPEEEKISAALEKVADEHGVESLSVIALAYVRQKAPNVFPIVGG
ncbi:uncharacterized protein Z518_06093 [Rhinocladiella mackenziei CBS 650.93]|uniref:NADP-dependent oxidoreductase domain-containing protein n=1 Tax=Rhinocladiella mackenziei CBS 650.93 TaxID=1442369 RepID=A0A0D2IPV7_9EURO|nr:uncharacterized protein Z518_06093 [Rhinocladiella mackenziei CBS 650.93]KIX05221.1 hypothetical protein Z518_06093 [Rhinocladiella mackenziei CBS 650.93]